MTGQQHPIPAVRPVLLAVVGPPGAGKSSLTRNLTTHGVRGVFRLREFVDEHRDRADSDHDRSDRVGVSGHDAGHNAGRAVSPGRDRLGWLSEHTVDALVEAAVAEGRIGGSGVTLLEGFPGSRYQTRLLHRIGAELDAAVLLVELGVPDEVALARARSRRVCPECEPDRRGDPHRPAVPDHHYPERCAACGGLLACRPSDAAPILGSRLRRYRRRITGIRWVAAHLGLPHVLVDATAAPQHSLRQVLALLAHRVAEHHLIDVDDVVDA